MKAHFLREEGIQQGQTAYDRYATSLANNQSAKSSDPGFCSTIDTFIRMATAASQPDLLVLAQSISPAPPSGACQPSNYAGTEPNGPTNAPAAAVAVEPAAGTVTAEAVTEAKPAADAAPAAATTLADAQAKVEPTPAVAEAPKVATAAAAAPATAAQPAVSREDALQAAVIALQSAAAALQAASTSTPPADAAPQAKAQTVAAVKVEDAPVVPPKEATTP